MKKVLLTLIVVAFVTSVKSQTFFNHGIGAYVGFASEGNRTFSGEYEMNVLSESKGYKQGFITGAGASFPIKNENRELINAIYVKGGYRLSGLSFGVNVGGKNTRDTKSYDSGYEFILGGFLGVNVSKRLKMQVGGDSFNGFSAGLVLFPNTIRSNTR